MVFKKNRSRFCFIKSKVKVKSDSKIDIYKENLKIKMSYAKRFSELMKKKSFSILRTIFKKKTSFLTLNDDCIDLVLRNLSLTELANISNIRNHRIRSLGQTVFCKKLKNAVTISSALMKENSLMCIVFGQMIVKMELEFRG